MQVNVFRVIETWRHLQIAEFQDMLQALVISGAVNRSSTLRGYGYIIKKLTEGYCSMAAAGRSMLGAGAGVEREAGMPGWLLPMVRN